MEKRIIAAILALLVGGLGAHKFYMGKYLQGVIYILFCWTCIPSLVALVEGILYLVETEENFEKRLN